MRCSGRSTCTMRCAHHGHHVLSGSSTLGVRTMRVSELERERVSPKPLEIDEIDERPRASRPSELGVLGFESGAAPCCW